MKCISENSSSELKIIKDRSSGQEEVSVITILATPEGDSTGYEYTGKSDDQRRVQCHMAADPGHGFSLKCASMSHRHF